VTLAREHGALSLVDAAQVAGWLPLDVARLGVDLLAFAGHKGPQGPSGIGGLYVAPHVAMRAPRAGAAAWAELPGFCDTGSLDRPALAGLAAGLRWIAAPERADRLARARARVQRLAEGVDELPGVKRCGPAAPEARMPTLAVTVAGRTPAELARALEARGTVASGGLQCAASAHETLGTLPHGVLRLSLGPASTDADVEGAIGTLREVVAP
jgi:selenocysteine lyase/cysteine desulfurase